MRTLKEQCLYLHQFASLAEARLVIGALIHRHNTEWLIARLGYRTPAAARAGAWAEAAKCVLTRVQETGSGKVSPAWRRPVRFLPGFTVRFNARLARSAADTTPALRPVPRRLELDRRCSLYTPATVLNDNTVRIQGNSAPDPTGPGGRGYAKARVEVRQLLDGSWRIYYGACSSRLPPP